jgi:hypothetical protein
LFFTKETLFYNIYKTDIFKIIKQDEENNSTIKVVWIGSRSTEKQTFTIENTMTIRAFKKMVFDNNHGTEFCPIKFEFEEDWTLCHNVVCYRSGKILDKDRKTFAEYGMEFDVGVPFELSFKMIMKGGGKRGRITGEVKLTPANAAKIAQFPAVLTILSAAKFDEDDLKGLISNMTNDQLQETITMWDHSKLNYKHKIVHMVGLEPNLRIVDEVTELTQAYISFINLVCICINCF